MIAILDYGLGNVSAFMNIYRKLNIDAFLASDSNSLSKATHLILPGVGSFDYAMKKLQDSGMTTEILEHVLQRKTPILGVCVGMQMLADGSEEGLMKGLSLIPGYVKKFSPKNDSQNKFPVPHMGWNKVIFNSDEDIFKGLSKNPFFYFLHSYYFECTNNKDCIGLTKYCIQFPSIIRHKNIYGLQCHPEKSHESGIKILENFAMLTNA